MIELLLRLAISMAVVMAVMSLAARFVRRRQEAGLGGGFGSRRAGRTMGTGGPGSVRLRAASRSSRAGGAEGGGGTCGVGGPGGESGLGGPNGPSGGPSTLTNKLGSVFGAPRARRARPIPPVEVVYRRALAKNASVAVIQATGKQFLLGVTEQSITLLAELPDPTVAADATPLEADLRASRSVPRPTGVPMSVPEAAQPEATGGPATSGDQMGARENGAQISDLEVWGDLEDWQQADRMPASPPDASNSEHQNAWKLTLDSLRERTIRR